MLVPTPSNTPAAERSVEAAQRRGAVVGVDDHLASMGS